LFASTPSKQPFGQGKAGTFDFVRKILSATAVEEPLHCSFHGAKHKRWFR
jgi:hypothetical protein